MKYVDIKDFVYDIQRGMLRIFDDGTSEFYSYSTHTWVVINTVGYHRGKP